MKRLPGSVFSDADLAAFYDVHERDRADHAYCRALAQPHNSVLDLGCGTGTFALSLAHTHDLCAVDPAQAMLDIAQSQSEAHRITWINQDALSLSLDRTFDLIVLTGHSFQVFLTTAQQNQLLQTIKTHLSPDGQFIFDTRNPDFPGKKTRTKDETLCRITSPQHGEVAHWNISTYDQTTQILSYSNSYKVLDTKLTYTGFDQIRYTPQSNIETMLAQNHLQAMQWLGEWDGTPFQPISREIIVVGTHV